jgi:hypothetical protein
MKFEMRGCIGTDATEMKKCLSDCCEQLYEHKLYYLQQMDKFIETQSNNKERENHDQNLKKQKVLSVQN